ncbi:CRISPR-associated endoribonuclease Cas6 [Chitinophaga sp. MM2321]|uniref:CRISPR-associated endoribonuclease Cas6 n=1 Tax=Chitinophaga sp. MM2321 TaxID=3137178 RepID=UPI0032D5A3C9
MKFKLILSPAQSKTLIPINYSYPLSAVIYKILDSADRDYAEFLHSRGYTQKDSLKAFKLFTFSDIKTPFRIVDDRLHFLSDVAELVVSFHLPQVAENFIKGLFLHQRIEIADQHSRAIFSIDRVETLAAIPVMGSNNHVQELLLKPTSPVVCGSMNEQGHYNFLAPNHPDFMRVLLFNWKEKFRALHGIVATDLAFSFAEMEVLLFSKSPRPRLITIETDTAAQTKIKGYANFRMKVKGTRAALELLVDGGVGTYCNMGVGSVEIV